MRREEGQKEGRLNINGAISVSLRRLSRVKEEGLSEEQMIDEILRNRNYLEG